MRAGARRRSAGPIPTSSGRRQSRLGAGCARPSPEPERVRRGKGRNSSPSALSQQIGREQIGLSRCCCRRSYGTSASIGRLFGTARGLFLCSGGGGRPPGSFVILREAPLTGCATCADTRAPCPTFCDSHPVGAAAAQPAEACSAVLLRRIALLPGQALRAREAMPCWHGELRQQGSRAAGRGSLALAGGGVPADMPYRSTLFRRRCARFSTRRQPSRAHYAAPRSRQGRGSSMSVDFD